MRFLKHSPIFTKLKRNEKLLALQRKRDEDEITNSQWQLQTNNLARITQLKEREIERKRRYFVTHCDHIITQDALLTLRFEFQGIESETSNRKWLHC